jgi:hypothetical protein
MLIYLLKGFFFCLPHPCFSLAGKSEWPRELTFIQWLNND